MEEEEDAKRGKQRLEHTAMLHRVVLWTLGLGKSPARQVSHPSQQRAKQSLHWEIKSHSLSAWFFTTHGRCVTLIWLTYLKCKGTEVLIQSPLDPKHHLGLCSFGTQVYAGFWEKSWYFRWALTSIWQLKIGGLYVFKCSICYLPVLTSKCHFLNNDKDYIETI
jgi:hypothetical protein